MTAPTMRIGHGYDLHRLEPQPPAGLGRPLILGGVRLEHDRGPIAHSDGDAVYHAVTDAILASIGEKDIGQLFPDDDPVHEGEDSSVFLEDAADRLQAAGYRIGNLDITVICERPRLSPHKPAMIGNIASLLRCDLSQVNLKGKTHEKVDAVGEGRAVEVHCVVLVVRLDDPAGTINVMSFPKDRHLWQNAASMAARAHCHQLRKDDRTPYVSHPMRVTLTLVCVFGLDDARILAASLLHDTIEDCGVDYDDILEAFGADVADYVAAMSKDMRLIEPAREAAYDQQLADGPWQGRAIKLADAFDNLSDVTDDQIKRECIARAHRALTLAAHDDQLATARKAMEMLVAEAEQSLT